MVSMRAYVDQTRASLEQMIGTARRERAEAIDAVETAIEDVRDRVAKLETWRAVVGGRTVALLAVIGLIAGGFGVLLGHLLGP